MQIGIQRRFFVGFKSSLAKQLPLAHGPGGDFNLFPVSTLLSTFQKGCRARYGS
uniref:hypothetical protein n=1 Tax=Salmonella sp. TaxID=599 RepID=UPI001CD9E80B|nr:hypothetical protein [Salmonella sp.]